MGQITFQFAKGNGIGGKLIEWYDHGKFAHVDCVLPDGTLLGARVEKFGNIPAGVQIRPASYLAPTIRTLKVSLPCPDSTEISWKRFLFDQIGKPYDMTAIAAFVTGRNWTQEDSWFCSELAAASLMDCGLIHKLSAPANKIAPDDLLLVCSALVAVEV